MVEQISKAIVSMMVDKNAVDPAEYEIYQYGLEIIISSLASFASAMFVGLLLGKPLPMFIFLTSFALMRMYSGGYHAKSYRTCFIELICISVVVQFVLYLVDRLPSIAAMAIVFALSFISLVIIFVLAPVDNSHAPLSEYEINCYRKVSRWISIGEIAIILVAKITFAPYSFIWPIAFGLFLASALVLAGHWIQIRKETNKVKRIINTCSQIIRAVAITGNSSASVWYMYQPKKPASLLKKQSSIK